MLENVPTTRFTDGFALKLRVYLKIRSLVGVEACQAVVVAKAGDETWIPAESARGR